MKKNSVQDTARQVVQNMLRREALKWPPDCMGFDYQPHRPEMPLVQYDNEEE